MFDGIITVGPHNLPSGVTPARAIVAIREMVNAIPGAAWISVEHHPFGKAETAIELCFRRPGEPAASELKSRVAAAVHSALTGLIPPPMTIPADRAFGGLSEQAIAFPQRVSGQDAATWFYDPLEPQSNAVAALPASGLSTVSDQELLGALLAQVVPNGSMDVARRVVARFGSFAAVLSQPQAELLKVQGLGPHSVAAIKLVHATALRLSQSAIMDQPAMTSLATIIPYLTAALTREPIEHFRILFLDGEGRIRADEAQARGTVDHTPVYPREIVRRAIDLDAAAVILVHNHPTGDPSPSNADLVMTRMVQDACTSLGLIVQDHIIVGNGRWFSFQKEGLL